VKDQYGDLEGEYDCNILFDLIHAEGAELED